MYMNEAVWAGEFGDEYHKRNPADDRRVFWSEIVKHLDPLPKSVIELGAGKGENLVALHSILPDLKRIAAVEINPTAIEELRKHEFIGVMDRSAWEFDSLAGYDSVVTRGFLIHVPKFALDSVLGAMGTAQQHVVMIEYMDEERKEVPYHDREGLLWRDDFRHAFLYHPRNRNRWTVVAQDTDPKYKTTTVVFKRSI